MFAREPFVPVSSTAVTACPNIPYTLPWGQAVSSSGLYSDTLKADNGCDNLIKQVRVNFTNNYDIRFGIDSTCSGQIYTLPWGATATFGGTYFDTIRRVNGCDSIIYMFTLKVKGLIIEKDTANLCAGSSFTLPWGLVVDTAGVYNDTVRYPGKLTCDSLIREVKVSFDQLKTETTGATFCENGNYTLPWGQVVTTPATYRDTIKAKSGCDSLIKIINLGVNVPLEETINKFLKSGEAYTLPWGTVVTTAGIYRDTLYYKSGCDSLRWIVNLSVDTLPIVSTNEFFCNSSSHTLPWGQVVSSAGIYRDTLKGDAGRDSLIREVILSNRIVQLLTSSVTICEGSAYVLPWGVTVVEPEIYKDTLQSTEGCDSLIRIVNLSVEATPLVTLRKSNDINCTVSTAQLTITGGFSYTWWPAERLNNTTSPDPIASPVKSTVYHVLVSSANGCQLEDSITVYVYSNDLEKDYLVPNAFTPDGDGKNDCFGIGHWGAVTELNFTIYDRWVVSCFKQLILPIVGMVHA